VKTRHLAGIYGATTSFDRLINSELGQRYLRQARGELDARERAAHDAATRPKTPHVEVVRRKIAEQLHRSLANDPTPAISKWDAAQLAVRTARANPRDYGLRRAALTLHRIWTIDKEGALTIADLAELRRRATGEYPKSMARVLFDEVLPAAGFHQLPVKRLRALAATIHSQADYDRTIRNNGLDGSDPLSRRARAFMLAEINRTAVTPPGVSEETMHELKRDPDIKEPYAVAWSIQKDKDKKGRQAGDAGDAGEQAFHPDVPEEGQSLDDAVDADKIVKGRRADKPSEPEFNPGVAGQSDDAEKLAEEDAELRASGRRAQTDEPEDAELGEQVEQLVDQHERENAPAEEAEESRMATKKVSRARIEDILLEGKQVRVGRYRLQLGTNDQVEMTSDRRTGEPPMVWPLRRMTAAIDYFARVVEGQALEAGEVNDQQPDAVKPPKAKQPLGEESSGQDVDSLEAGSIEQEHPAQDQPGTSEPAANMGEGVNEEEGFSDPTVKPQHPGADQAGTSLPDTNLGRHSSDEEPAAFDVGKVSPGRSARKRVDRVALRDALRGTLRHVRGPDDPENV